MRYINRYSLTDQKIDHQVFGECKQLTVFFKSQNDKLGNICGATAPAFRTDSLDESIFQGGRIQVRLR